MHWNFIRTRIDSSIKKISKQNNIKIFDFKNLIHWAVPVNSYKFCMVGWGGATSSLATSNYAVPGTCRACRTSCWSCRAAPPSRSACSPAPAATSGWCSAASRGPAPASAAPTPPSPSPPPRGWSGSAAAHAQHVTQDTWHVSMHSTVSRH